MEICEPNAATEKLVQIRSLYHIVSMGADVSVPLVIRDNQHDIRFFAEGSAANYEQNCKTQREQSRNHGYKL